MARNEDKKIKQKIVAALRKIRFDRNTDKVEKVL
jgi:hypothetical protein